MDKLFPFLRQLSALRKADFESRLPLLLRISASALVLAALMTSLAFWTCIDGLSLPDFFMLSILQVLTILSAWLGAHCLWPQAEEVPTLVQIMERGGELFALACLYTGAALFITGFFPSGHVVGAYFSAFPLLGGFSGTSGGIAALCLSIPLAGMVYAILRGFARYLGPPEDEQGLDENEFDD